MQRTIYDIGANDGSDTAFYLAKGFRVVAVEADPELCAALRGRFGDEIETDRLRIVNVGVSDEKGTATFYKNAYSDWSSFMRASKATSELSHVEMTLPLAPLSDIIAENGAPYYIKLDIEGFELQAVCSLAAGDLLPLYLSVEINSTWAQIADRLVDLGFDGFQLVRQGRDHLSPPPDPSREGATHVVRFTNRHSGCFGRDLPDEWVDRAALDPLMERTMAERAARRARGEPPGWHDLHARRGAALG